MPISFVRIADEIKSKISYLRLLFMMKTGFVCPKLCSDILHDTHQLLFLGGAEHGDARLPEVGDALEDGACRQMPARMQDATVLVDACDAGSELLFEDVQFPGKRALRVSGTSVQIVAHLLEYPWPSEGGTPNHDGIHSVAFKALLGTLGGGDVAIADDGDMDAWIAFHLADERPVSIACVHLRTGTTVDGERLYAAVLQLLCQRGDNQFVTAPAQPGFDGDGDADRLDHLACDVEHQRDVAQHARTGTLARHLLYRTAEIEVDDIRMRLLHNLCSLDHRLYVAPVNLDAHGALLVADGEFLHRTVDGAYQRFGAYELGVDPIFIISFVLIRKTLINHTHNELNDKFKIASREIDEEFIKVETISDLLIDSYQSETLTKEYATSIKRLISTSSKAISAIYITHNNSDIFSYSQENSPVNHFKIGTNSQDNWLIRNNNEIVFSKTIDDHTILTIYILPSKIISLLKKEMNKEKIFPLLLNGKDKNVLSEQEYESELSDEIVEIINRNIPDKKQIIKTKKGKFYFFSFYYEKPDLYLTLAEPITVINPVMIQYTSILMSILFISIALFVTMVLSSSNRIIKSIEEIVQNIKKSKYLSSDTIVYENEAVLISKSFDILENRLSLYEKNLEKITSKSQLLEKDLKIAQKLQRNLLPTLMPSLSERKEFSLYAISDSVFDIGGDLFDYFLIDDNHLLVAVADVSGKGIPASLFMIY